MKRSHISSLQQSNRKNNPSHKTDRSGKKTIKSIFQQHKQNLHPNVVQQTPFKKCCNLKSQLKYKNSKKAQKSKNFVQAYLENDQESFLSPFKPKVNRNQKEQLANSLTNQCLKLQRLVNQKKQKQLKKCTQYYDWIRQEIDLQEKATIAEINDCFFEAHRQVQEFLQKIDNLTGSKVLLHQFSIEVPLLSIVISQQIKQFLKIQISKLNLSKLNQQTVDNFQESHFQGIKFQKQNHARIIQTQGLKYNYQGRKSRENLAFEHAGQKGFEQYELSPSFKHF